MTLNDTIVDLREKEIAQTKNIVQLNASVSGNKEEVAEALIALGYFIVGLFCYICSCLLFVVIFLYLCLVGCSLRFTCRG
jgi:hypothetical protein